MNNFQTIVVAVFLAFFIFAVLIFSGILKIGGSSSSSSGPSGKVVIWGTFPSSDITKVFDDLNTANKDLIVTYVKKPESTYQQSLIEAFANGTGPDLFFITPSMVIKNQKFIYTIPFTSYPQKTFQDTFVDGANIYLANDGVIGFPIVLDPMMLYYNKDILSNEGLAAPAAYWDELFTLNSTLTKKKNDGTILQSMIALGQYDNVNHAKDILATLLLQGGDSIVSRTGNTYNSVLSGDPSVAVSPVENVMKFFVEFSNPSDSAYSWNRAMPNSLDAFTGGQLVFYLGRASELFKIQSVNPNLSFDVAPMLQTKGAAAKRTYADIYALSVNKRSTNLATSLSVAGLLASPENATAFSTALSLPPVQRALLSVKPADPYLFAFFNSAIISRSWPDPDPVASDSILSELVNNILSNKLSISDAVSKAEGRLELVISQQ